MMRKWIDLMEAPISHIEWHGGDEGDQSFDRVDRDIWSSPKGLAKIVRAFEKTPFVFEIYAFNGNVADAESERDNDEVDNVARRIGAGIHNRFYDVEGEAGKIKVVLMGNLSPLDAKRPLNGWIVAHKIAHAIQDGVGVLESNRRPLASLVQTIVQKVCDCIAIEDGSELYTVRGYQFPAWIGEHLTMKSAPGSVNAFETFAEIIAQYLISGKVTMKLTKKEAIDRVPAINDAISALFTALDGKVLSEI